MICQTEVHKGTNTEITIDIDDVNLPGMMYMWNNMASSADNKEMLKNSEFKEYDESNEINDDESNQDNEDNINEENNSEDE